ncbi:RNA polymerase sigma factor [Myxococcota bacterium]|nr:RNA polymerase sigma factor [Myxococcota bacterium]MCZ7619266.1 RNA polymerase sigma factor [Myxococcota bacterium]
MESDEELMAAVARGDERALGILVERHTPRLHAHLTRMTGSGDDAEDLLQETWLRVARGARSFQEGRPVRPWLFGIASNLARDFHRRRSVRRHVRHDASPGQTPPGARPLETIALRDRVRRLPDRLREILWLRFYEGFTEAEMAEALGIPRGTVKSRLHGAIRELKRGWEGRG